MVSFEGNCRVLSRVFIGCYDCCFMVHMQYTVIGATRGHQGLETMFVPAVWGCMDFGGNVE